MPKTYHITSVCQYTIFVKYCFKFSEVCRKNKHFQQLRIIFLSVKKKQNKTKQNKTKKASIWNLMKTNTIFFLAYNQAWGRSRTQKTIFLWVLLRIAKQFNLTMTINENNQKCRYDKYYVS